MMMIRGKYWKIKLNVLIVVWRTNLRGEISWKPSTELNLQRFANNSAGIIISAIIGLGYRKDKAIPNVDWRVGFYGADFAGKNSMLYRGVYWIMIVIRTWLLSHEIQIRFWRKFRKSLSSDRRFLLFNQTYWMIDVERVVQVRQLSLFTFSFPGLELKSVTLLIGEVSNVVCNLIESIQSLNPDGC